jgi:hypothetical protein
MCDAVKNRNVSHQQITVNNEQGQGIYAYAVMIIDDSGYYSFQELNDSVYLFHLISC